MSSSSGISATTINGTTRITGLSSGIDVDGIVEQLMTAEKAKKLNKLEQKEQTAEWKQEAYRTIISDIQTFSDTYCSTTSSTSVMKSGNFLQYNATSSDSAVSVTAASTASAGSHQVTVSQLAKAATYTSGSSISKDVQGSSAMASSFSSSESFVMTLDGTSYTVALSGVTDTTTLQTAINTAVGSGKVTVSTNSSGYLEMTAADSGVNKITVSATSSSNSGLTDLGFGDDAVLSNRLDTSDTLATIKSELNSTLSYNSDGEIALTINGTTETFEPTDTLADMISTINKADLGVTMSYNSITGELEMTADDTGSGNTVTVADSGTCNFASLLLSDYTAGKDCKMTVDGQSLTRSSNSVTIDGVTYTANAETTSTDTVTVTQDTDGVYDLIKNFVDDYNTLLETIKDKINENADSDYSPLTDDQKSSMTDEEITKWEAKAKVGILEDDSTLSDFLSELRTGVIDSISGATTTLAQIGITTSSTNTDGTLEIDEDTLKSAIASDPEAIMNLFTQQATSTSSSGSSLSGTVVERTLSSSDYAKRYKEEGIGWRFYDTLQEYISTYTDSSGSEGKLLEIAGTTDDSSSTDNQLTTKIDKYEDEISEEEDRLDDYEDKLYSKYSTLETYINQMNTQLSALSSMTSS